ncbi:MAG: sulfur carrier protein ThiS adenylyltransferase ThiF [Eubacterium sp.]|nr:sulfur carrier protein ThiS adenylyltransferase ThiF [Eubacterium sp.]
MTEIIEREKGNTAYGSDNEALCDNRGSGCCEPPLPSEAEFDAAKDERFSAEIHARLKNAGAAVAGLGGLGSHIAVMLARSGIGQLHLVDFDRVELSNLNRQVYLVEHIGRYKTEALCEILQKINPYMNISYETLRIDRENAADTFSKYKYVCEAFDKPEAKAMLVSEILARNKDTIIVSGSGMAGYGEANEIKTRRVMSRLYVCGDGISDANAGIGLMAPRVMICAGHQANMVIRLILGE